MEKLPPELLSKIMLFMPPMDRLSCSLTCRRFAALMSSSQLLDDVRLGIARHEMEAAFSVLANSQRKYTKMVLYEADLSKFDSEFWRKIGANLRELELRKCSWSNHVFYAILQRCTQLESLKLVNGPCGETSIDDFALPDDVCREELHVSLNHLRHLHLELKLTADILDLLLGLMSNVSSIFLSSELDKVSDFLERLPSILDKNRIIRVGAAFVGMRSDEVIEFVKITSGSLEEVEIHVHELTDGDCDAIANCTRLRRLTLKEEYAALDASYLKKLVSNSPNLGFLDIELLKAEDIVHLSELKKLRVLALRGWWDGPVTNDALCSLREISTLVKLDLSGLDVDRRVMRSLGFLPSLQSLVLDTINMSSECFGAICESLEWLTELDVGRVHQLTDADGMKFCRFERLRSLAFSSGFGFTDLTFAKGVGSRALKSLMIYGCSITDVGLQSIAAHHDRLEVLTLGSCKRITDAGVKILLDNEPRLTDLYLEYPTASIKSEWRTGLRDRCPRLRSAICVGGVMNVFSCV